jgi:ATP-dependent Zn protease
MADDDNDKNVPVAAFTKGAYDEEITRIIEGRYAKSVGFIEGKKETVDKIAKRLLEVETIGAAEPR